jgi:exodeoxyribonuclease VII large subunit
MNWTNDFNLCEQICNFPIPVMSAVGHTVDQSIVDMISKYPCKTPSEGAQILIEIYQEFQDNIDSEFEYINNCVHDFSDKYKQELKFISKNLPLQVTNKIRVYKQNLETFSIDRKIGYNLRLISNNLEIVYHNILANNTDKILSK